MRRLAVLLLLSSVAYGSDYCRQKPTSGPAASIGRPSRGRLEGAVRLVESDSVRILPRRHRGRCLDWATPRLVAALERAGRKVRERHPGSPPLSVGNLSAARGGPIPPYSRSHQCGRDADLAFYQLDEKGSPVSPEDLSSFDEKLRSLTRRFDVRRNWALVQALLEDDQIEVKWLFVSRPLKAALLAEGRRTGADEALLAKAKQLLHQPSDAPPHDDHFHLRIRCTASERRRGCSD